MLVQDFHEFQHLFGGLFFQSDGILRKIRNFCKRRVDLGIGQRLFHRFKFGWSRDDLD